MWVEVVGGFFIGLFAPTWPIRLILPLGIGVWAMGSLWYWKRKARRGGLSRRHKAAMRREDMSEEEVDEAEGTWRDFGRMFMKESGLGDQPWWKLYGRQFIGSTVTALAFAALGGLLRPLLF